MDMFLGASRGNADMPATDLRLRLARSRRGCARIKRGERLGESVVIRPGPTEGRPERPHVRQRLGCGDLAPLSFGTRKTAHHCRPPPPANPLAVELLRRAGANAPVPRLPRGPKAAPGRRTPKAAARSSPPARRRGGWRAGWVDDWMDEWVEGRRPAAGRRLTAGPHRPAAHQGPHEAPS